MHGVYSKDPAYCFGTIELKFAKDDGSILKIQDIVNESNDKKETDAITFTYTYIDNNNQEQTQTKKIRITNEGELYIDTSIITTTRSFSINIDLNKVKERQLTLKINATHFECKAKVYFLSLIHI